MQATPDDLAAGRVAGCFGIRGELKCDVANAARSLFVVGARFRYRGATEGDVRIAAVREHKNRLLVTFEGIRDRNAAEAFVGATLYVERTAIPLRTGEYLDADLVGCLVVGNDGREYGSVERVEHFPSSDMLVVCGRMIPMVAGIVLDVDTVRERITVDPPAGLL